MEHSGFYKELIRKTAHRFPDEIKRIYLVSRKLYDQYLSDEEKNKMGVKNNRDVLDVILPSISIYHAILKCTGNTNKAYEVVARTFDDYYQDQAEHFREACNNPLAYYLIPSMAAKFIKKNYTEDLGFEVVNKSKGLKSCHFDIVKCPYHDYCKAYSCEDLTSAFCDAPDHAFHHLHRGISWDRTRALGRGDECCDFIITMDD